MSSPKNVLLVFPLKEKVTNGPSLFVKNVLSIQSDEVKYYLLSSVILDEFADITFRYKEIQLGRLSFLSPLFDNIFIYLALKKVLKSIDFDVVLFCSAYHGSLSSLLCIHPKIIGMHNDVQNMSKLKWEKNLGSKLYHWINSSLFYISHLRYAKIILNSKFMLAKFSDYSPACNTVILYKSVNLNNIVFRQRDAKTWVQSKIKKVLFIKSNYKRGGLHILVEALNYLSNEYTFLLTIIGSEKADLTLIDRAKFQIKWVGPMKNSLVIKQFEEHLILCVPSLEEALGVVNIEGMASGIPVVSSDAGGIPEVLGYGKFGYISKRGNHFDLAKIIKECLSNPELTIQKTIIARKAVEDTFAIEKMMSNLHEILFS